MINHLIRRLAPRAGAMALALPLLAAPGACSPSAPASPTPEGKPPCSGYLITMPERGPFHCDVTPPQVIIAPGMTASACADHGGQFLIDRHGGDLCFDIDY